MDIVFTDPSLSYADYTPIRGGLCFILSTNDMPQAQTIFCFRCTYRLLVINKDVLVIWQGEGYPYDEIPRHMGFVQKRCHRCKTLYTFYFQ